MILVHFSKRTYVAAAFILLLAAPPALTQRKLQQTPARPNVLLVTVDTLRADFLGCYGSTKVATPNVDALAAEGVRFRTAVAPAPLTLPSHCTILTGKYPLATGVRDNLGYALTANHLTLAEILKQNGYRTAAFVSAYVLDSKWGLDQGFDHYDDSFPPAQDAGPVRWAVERSGGETADAALKWLDANRSAPFFCWIHLFDPHDPYLPPEPYRSRYRDNPYGGEVAYTDSVAGRIFESLRRNGAWDRTLVVLAGDHGEGLGEHQEPTHGYYLYDSTSLVPLVFKLPRSRSAGRVIDFPVQLADVAPTLLQALEIPRPANFQGRGWFGALLGKQQFGAAPPAYVETYYPNEFGWSELRAWRTADYKYVLAPQAEFYDLRADAGEQNNLIASKSALAEQYKAALLAFETRYGDRGAAAAAQARLSVEDRERFRALGYIGGPTAGRLNRALERPDPKSKIELFCLISNALTEMARSEFSAALEILQQLVRRDPSITTAYSLIGQCYLQLKRYSEARDTFERVVANDPDRVYPAYYLGLTYFHLRQYERAAPLLEKAVALDPGFFPAHNYLGFIYSDQGQDRRAIDAFSRAVRIQESPQSYQMLGLLYVKGKQLDQAQKAFHKVTVLEPGNALAHFYLASVYKLQGRPELAKKSLQKAVELDPSLRDRIK